MKTDKKIGIVTLNGEFNYGNRLQAFALQRQLQSMGHTPHVLQPQCGVYSKLKNSAKRIIALLPIPLQRLSYWRMMIQKRKVFRPFSSQHIDTVSVRRDGNGLKSHYDLFIAGSDQVWNPHFAATDFHLLTFARSDQKFSYAASFGVSSLTNQSSEYFKKRLSDFSAISVRETEAVSLVGAITGHKGSAQQVPDPTMLLSYDDWCRISEKHKPAFVDERKYIIVYALHQFSAVNQARVECYAKDNNLQIIQIMGDIYNPRHVIPSPLEFVWLIFHAEAVFTDSFHCSVFSILSRRPFAVFDRTDGQKMSSRIHTLTKKFQLSQAMCTEEDDIADVLDSEDFRSVDDILKKEKKIGIEFIERIIA